MAPELIAFSFTAIPRRRARHAVVDVAAVENAADPERPICPEPQYSQRTRREVECHEMSDAAARWHHAKHYRTCGAHGVGIVSTDSARAGLREVSDSLRTPSRLGRLATRAKRSGSGVRSESRSPPTWDTTGGVQGFSVGRPDEAVAAVQIIVTFVVLVLVDLIAETSVAVNALRSRRSMRMSCSVGRRYSSRGCRPLSRNDARDLRAGVRRCVRMDLQVGISGSERGAERWLGKIGARLVREKWTTPVSGPIVELNT